MKILNLVKMLLVAFAIVSAMSCMDRKPGPQCPVLSEVAKTKMKPTNFDKVDMLVVVDDSASMAEEQSILATAFYPLVNSLVTPVADWKYSPIDDVRIGIVSSDMGLQYGTNDECSSISLGDSCDCLGLNAELQIMSAASIDVQSGVIPCDDDAAQCPAGWTCAGNNCSGPNPVNCGTLNATWTETLPGAPNTDINLQTACLAQLGMSGCGIEQQLLAASKGLVVNSGFVRQDKSLLVVLIVSDEEDCSMKDGSIFDDMEVDGRKTPSEINLTCGNNESKLFEESFFYSAILNVKNGLEGSVIFAAIVGVPQNDACQGRGIEIANCLDETAMQNVPVEETDADPPYMVFRAACTRSEGSVDVTVARPGRRYVRLARQFGELSYIYSICNADWSPAMENIAQIINEAIEPECYPKPLSWDAQTEKANCSVMVRYQGETVCPPYFELESGVDSVRKVENVNGNDENVIYCPLAKLSAPLLCEEANAKYENANDFGWYYCEDQGRENFKGACDPDGKYTGIDEDNDGLTDCMDMDCWGCQICEAFPGVDPKLATSPCVRSCKYAVQLSKAAQEHMTGQQIVVQCQNTPVITDNNCSESNQNTCRDNIDNDGNGVFDCWDVLPDIDVNSDDIHLADSSCCPMTVDEDGKCKIQFENNGTKEGLNTICNDRDNNDVEDFSGVATSLLPSACEHQKKHLGCEF